MSMVTATAWVPRGFAAPFPTKYDFDEGEYERIAKLAKMELNDAQDDLDEAEDKGKNDDEMDDDGDDSGSGSDLEESGPAKIKSKG